MSIEVVPKDSPLHDDVVSVSLRAGAAGEPRVVMETSEARLDVDAEAALNTAAAIIALLLPSADDLLRRLPEIVEHMKREAWASGLERHE